MKRFFCLSKYCKNGYVSKSNLNFFAVGLRAESRAPNCKTLGPKYNDKILLSA